MTQLEPIHSDRPKNSFIQVISPALSAMLVVLGFIGGELLYVIVGLGMGSFIWFTRHGKYEIFSDRLTIHYGKPRCKVVKLDDIGDAQAIKVPMGGAGIMIRMKTRGGGMLIRPLDPDLFLSKLNEACQGLPQSPVQ